MSKSQRDPLKRYIAEQQQRSGLDDRDLFGRSILIDKVFLDKTSHPRPEDLGYPLLGLGIGILLLDVIFSVQVIWAHKFDFEVLLPLVAFGAFGLILLIGGIVMLPKHRQKKIHHKNKK